ncbi:hypothetical protein [Actinokineospora enzanensis]|uniref:hypothetical protein n=1 Tax=Actinokineospora enzanensis TaxID=155975 RepID=UPI0003749910|nr:hypothetical protein [Actinokineospora enzanensis]
MQHTPISIDTVVSVNSDCPISVEQTADGIELHFNENRLGQLFTLQFTQQAFEALVTVCQTGIATD